MSVLDIGFLSGFTVNMADLDMLSIRRGLTITKYEMNTFLSERGSLIIYLHQVSHTVPEEITFRIHQNLKLGILQPAAVSVYEYYAQTPCVKYYHPERMSGQQYRCGCAERKKGQTDDDQRTAKLCERTDFAYKMRVEEFTAHWSTDIYTVRVLGVIKEGGHDVGTLDTLRTLVSYPFCRQSLNLQTGKTYLIMGTSEDIHRDDQNRSHQYVLGQKTWIEYWPTEAECQTEVFRSTCLGLMGMQQMFTVFGCLQ